MIVIQMLSSITEKMDINSILKDNHLLGVLEISTYALIRNVHLFILFCKKNRSWK